MWQKGQVSKAIHPAGNHLIPKNLSCIQNLEARRLAVTGKLLGVGNEMKLDEDMETL